MGNLKVEIEKLDGSGDFRMWRRKIKGLLAQQKLLRAHEESLKWPDDWSEDQKQELLETATDRMFGFRMKTARTLDQNLDDFLRMNIKLANSSENGALNDENQAIILLNALPKSFKEVKSAIKYGRTSITLEEVISTLKARDLEIKTKESLHRGRIILQGVEVRNVEVIEREEATIEGKVNHPQKALDKGEDGYESGKVLLVLSKAKDQDWVLDYDCTYHMTHNKSCLTNFREVNGGKVMMGDSHTCQVEGLGTIAIKMFDGIVRIFKDVRYVPSLAKNLISLDDGLYHLIGDTLTGKLSVAVAPEDKKVVLGTIGLLKFKAETHESKAPLEYVHSDLWGPETTATHGGNLYFLSIVDDYSRKAGLPKNFWGEDVMTVAYLVNRCPSNAIEFKTPEELWRNKPPDMSHLRTFGCAAYAHKKEGKLDPISVEPPKGKTDIDQVEHGQTRSQQIDYGNTSDEPESQSSDVMHYTPEHDHDRSLLDDYVLVRDRSKRVSKPTQRYGFSAYSDPLAYAFTTTMNIDKHEPESYKEAVSCKEASMWIKAMKEEMSSLYKNGT
ncbi:uncharacterized protein LOC112092973 [Morus notabilis]|uniref:uncharacterized protein LOC112092973 n=1 Tax=Morus notabilis TaxID=981085 RepID=UPI000CED1B27|nr:uncharacterized protein LOC112092973 [Morus notabilis]